MGCLTAHTVLLQSKVNDVLRELLGGSSGHLGINKTLDEVRHAYCILHTANGVTAVQQAEVCEFLNEG
jgi:hypothetical protein